MGEIVFVPTSDFNNYGSGDSSGFSINVVQTCTPYTVSIQILGSYDDYDYQFYQSGKILFCDGTITHDGSGSGIDGNIYEVCVGSPFIGGKIYDVYVNISGCSPCISEAHSFQADECASGSPLIANYDCLLGLQLDYICINEPCIEVTITKGIETEIVALPLTTELYLENGTYTITIGGISVELIIYCSGYHWSNINNCLAGETTFYPVYINVYPDIDYRINIYSLGLSLLHTEVVRTGEQIFNGSFENVYAFELTNMFNTLPPVEENTEYIVELEHIGLNALPKLGVFNTDIINDSVNIRTIYCDNIINSNSAFITDITCSALGIEVTIEVPILLNIVNMLINLYSVNGVLLKTHSYTFTGESNKRKFTIPYQSFGRCINNKWKLSIEYLYGYDQNSENFYIVDFPKIEISTILNHCHNHCPWVQYCTEDPET